MARQERKKDDGRRERKPSGEIAENRESLDRMLCGAGIPLDSRRFDLLWRYHQLIRQHNEEYDLTRLRSFRDFVEKHYLDCLVVPRLTKLPSPLLDIGTGAGFPGIPLKIAAPDCEIILSESRSKRNEFLRIVIERLGLERIEVLGRGIVAGRPVPPIGGVITRAVESAAETIGRVKDILEPGGRVILMKGPGGEGEIAEALRLHGGDYRLHANIPYTLPGTAYERRLIIFEKTTPSGSARAVSPAPGETVITSEANASFREWKSLLSGRGIRKAGMALVSGAKIVGEVLAMKPEIVRAWIGFPRSDDPPVHLAADIPRFRLARELFDALDVHGTGTPLLLVGVPAFRPLVIGELPDGAILFIPFQDPANVGAVIRSAAAFGARTAVLLREAANPFHPKSIRAAGTAVFLMDFIEGPSIRDTGALDLPCVALSAEGEDIREFRFPRRFALIPGVEGPGLPDDLLPAARVRIPMTAGVESLNAAVAASIALYEWRRGVREDG